VHHIVTNEPIQGKKMPSVTDGAGLKAYFEENVADIDRQVGSM